ncbi:MAG: murein hydrolase activator EnvC family protein [Candidatus Binatia bacterium]
MRATTTIVLYPLAGLFFLLCQGIYAADVGRELEGLKRRIRKERQGFVRVQRMEGSVLQGLEEIEEELDRNNKKLKLINSRLESILLDLQRKEGKVQLLSLSLRERRKFLKERVRALYKWRRGGSPLMLFNGHSVADLLRRKRYLELMLAKDQDLLENLIRESAQQEVLKKELAVKRKDLDRERKALVEVKALIRREREKKREILARLHREKKSRERALKELEQAALRLQKMMDGIGRKSLVKAVEAYPREDFASVKGRLEYPVRGRVVGGFGMTRHPEFSAKVFRKGIDIEAPQGEQISAVERGRVMFADRFSGYGKMIIIDHGGRYYTIYAHLSDLLKEVGETVRKGEAIALVGDSGSLRGSRLYFEIRKDGKALDPLPWFRK